MYLGQVSLRGLLGASIRKTLQYVGVLFVCFVGILFFGPTTAFAQVTLSGTLYTDAGVTPQAVSKFIAVAVGTSTPTTFSTTTLTTTGAWTLTIPAGHGIGTGTPIMVWVNDDVTFRATVLTKASSSASVQNITGLDLYQNRVIVRHEATSGTSTTNADFSFYTSTQDSDLQHSTSTGLLTIAAPNELYVWAGDTFAPGGGVTVAGNAGSGATEGSFYLDTSSIYTAGGALRLAGSLNAVSTATFTGGIHTTSFIATTTGKTINAPITSIGNVTFNGVGGGWVFASAATTTAFTLLNGTVQAPTSTLGVTGIFQNDATFTEQGGVLHMTGPLSDALGDIAAYAAGRDTSGSTNGAGNIAMNAFAVSSNNQTLYVGKAGSATTCNPALGSASDCELMVFSIASTTNPTYITARDSSGINASTSNVAIVSMDVSGNFLYVAKGGSATACSQTVGFASGCELMVFDISSTTNPIYVAGRDSDGTATSTSAIAATSIVIRGTTLYLAKAAAGTAACNTTASNCELMVFDISSSTNPIFVTGRDASNNNAGTQTLTINSLAVAGDLLFTAKAGSATGCLQTAGGSVGCELMVFDISSTTNPIFQSGTDVNGANNGNGNLAATFVTATGSKAYLAKAGNNTACSQTAGSALGCELMVFDVSSTTNPVYRRGVDVGGSQTGLQTIQINQLRLANNYLYVAKVGNATPCSQVIGLALGCELMVFDVSSSTAVRYIGGRDAGGDATSTISIGHNALTVVGNSLYAGRANSNTACSQVAGSAIGCELAVIDITRSGSGLFVGTLSSSSALGSIVASGTVRFLDNASTSNLTINAGTTTAPAVLSVGGDFTNSSRFLANEGTVIFASTSDQVLTGNFTAQDALYRMVLGGSATKTISSNASTTFMDVQSGTGVEFPSQFTVRDTFVSSGTLSVAGDTLHTFGFLNEFQSGLSAGGVATDTISITINAQTIVGNTLYTAKANSNTACSQSAGLAIGCELMVFSTASATSPTYVAGRDTSGSTNGTGNIAMNAFAVSSNNQTLYVGKAGSATTCNPALGSASDCELMVFDISSTTNPTYITARDSSGINASTSPIAIVSMAVSGNFLYVAKAGSATACSQVVGFASGCELMVFDISSTTNPIYVAGRDSDSTATSTSAIAATSIVIQGSTLYLSKAAAGAGACNTTVSNCELIVFNISSSTNPVYVTGRDVSNSAAGTQTLTINSLAVAGDLLFAAKAGSATGCLQTAGGSVGCELMIFNIASTTNPIFQSGTDVTGLNTGSGNLNAAFVAATGSIAYVAKAGNATACSQTAGSALGCELMVFDVSSTTNPVYRIGRDSDATSAGQTAIGAQTLLLTTGALVMGKAADANPCEQVSGLRNGCEFIFYKLPTTLSGLLTEAGTLPSLVTNGLTYIDVAASTTDVTIASSSRVRAPSTVLAIAGNLTIAGQFEHNQGQINLNGTNQTITTYATTTFYDFSQRATGAATTTFSTSSPFVILRNLTLQGAATSTPLRLRSTVSGTQWRLDAQSSTTLTIGLLDVKDSNNISATATPLVCGAGCLDSGNNLNWTIGVLVTISGTLFAEDGLTAYATATPLRLVIPLDTTYFANATSATSTGTYSFSVADQFLVAGNPYIVFADNSAAIKANTIIKSSASGASVSGLDLFRNHVVLRSQSTSTPLTSADLFEYTSVNDADIQYTVDNGLGLQVASPNALVVWDDSSFSPEAAVVVSGTATTTPTVGSMYLRSGARYTPASRTTLAGSFRASSTATYSPELAVLELNATTTAKVIDSNLTSLGSVQFNGTGGAWSFTQANATTSDFIIGLGNVTAPSNVLVVNGVFRNDATFGNNGGTVRSVGNTLDDIDRALTFATGLDTQARKTGSGAGVYQAFDVVGNYLYVGRSADGSLTCGQTAGSNAARCEIQVFNVSSTTNPTYVAGRDTDGSSAGSGASASVNDVVVVGNYLYVAKSGTTTPCSQVAGSAEGCELMVFDISSSTNPIYVAGRDADASAAGTASTTFNSLTVVDHYLYVAVEGDATACSQVVGSAVGCELQVYDIFNPTNPTYIAGRDGSGSSAGTAASAYLDIVNFGNVIYATKYGNAIACSQTAGSATGCELHVYNVSSSTNPVFAAGRDASGNTTGTAAITHTSLAVSASLLYIGKNSDATACSQTAGSATGCELMVFSIASTTNPIYVAGRDSSGDATGLGALNVASLSLHGNNLYVGKEGNTTACSQVAGSAEGCELMVFDVSSTTDPIFVAGRDNSGSKDGDQGRTVVEIIARDNVVYIGKTGNTTGCSQVTSGTGAIGCEMMVYTSLQPAGVVSGNLTSANALNSLETQNLVTLANNASTTNITIATSSTLTGSVLLSLSGDFTTSGTFVSTIAGEFLASSSATQNFTGSASSSSTFGDLTIGGSGTKNFDFNATTSYITTLPGTTVNYSRDFTIEGKYTNNGTVIAGETSELILTGNSPINNYIAGRDVSGSAAGAVSNLMTQMIRRGDYLFAAKGFSGTACAQTVGGAQGCELHVYDVSSSTNPVFVAGRDSTGDSTGTGVSAMYSPVIVGDTLFVSKSVADATACSQVAGSAIGCELMIFDISSSTNPVYVAGRDASGSTAGTGSVNATNLAVVANILFVLKEGNATACSQVAGSAIGCELMIFDISSTTNPIYVAGRDASGSVAGTGSAAMEDVLVVGSYLYISKGGDATACSQVAGSAIGCELMVFDISSTTNPIYVAGQDVSGDATGTGSAVARRLEVVGTALYMIDETSNATACSQVAGSAIGCELRVFDISSSTNPVYVAGRDASGDTGGTGAIAINEVRSYGNYLYIAKNADATACSQVAGSAIGCELMIFDISSTTNPIYVAGRDASGNQGGTTAVIVRELHFYGTNLYVTKSGDATACSQTAGSAIGCELMVFNVGGILQGNMTGSSAHQAVAVRGPAEWYHNASTSDLTISSTGIATVPPELSLAGDFSNSGQFNANNGTITLIGTDQQLTSSATTTFNNLIQIATTSATTSFSSTGGFVSTGMLQLQGTSPNRLKLRSTVDGAQWTILPQGSTSVAWLDVKDSNNSSSTVIECSNNCINRGNTTNWIFFSPLGTGTSTLAQHSAGQINNGFGAATSTDEEFLAFQIETNSGSTTFSNLVFGLEGVTGVNPSDLTNFRLVRDHNSNKAFDGADILVGGAGDVVWSGDSAVLGFYESFMATSTFDYLVIADVAPVANGSFLTIGIGPNGISSVDSTGAQTILGSAVSFQHSRNNRGAGGGSSSIGGAAPVGDGDVGGGDTTGGELIGSDPDFFWPTSNSGSWINGAFAYDGVDGTYATTSGVANHSYTNHGFGIPGSNVIGGIEVKLELSGSTADGTVDVQLSWDGGTSWTSTKSSPTLTTADVVRTLGSPSDLWGRTWTASEFGNANFAVRIAGNPSSNTIRLDAIQVRVYHVTGGGGSGGGGGI